ncbi:hypothetical protein I3I95_05060 [bacterium]|nr:hypothetical protein [bacterium]
MRTGGLKGRVLTWRTFLGMLALVAVLSVLFTFASCMVGASDDYARNAAADDDDAAAVVQATGDDLREAARQDDDAVPAAPRATSARTAVFVGDADASPHAGAVRAWCAYDGRQLAVRASVRAWFDDVAAGADDPTVPDVVIVDPAALAWDETDITYLRLLRGAGASLVLCDLPDEWLVASNADLRDLLGIAGVRAAQVDLTGLHLFAGLLPGGERTYVASDDDPDLLDGVSLQAPWYGLAGGAVAYLRGVVDVGAHPEAYGHDEVTPPLIWRYADDDGMTFVVCGDYLAGDTGAGLLRAFASEASDYALYPIANAQVLAIDAMPLLADENDGQLGATYARDAIALQRDVVWASLQRLALQTGATPTFFALAHLDADAEATPDAGDVEYFLRAIYELGGETGLSLSSHGSADPSAKADRDAAALASVAPGYAVSALSAPSRTVAAAALATGAGAYAAARTVVLPPAEDVASQDAEPLAGLLGVTGSVVTTQRATSDCRDFTAMDDLRLRAQEALLGWSVARLPMEALFYPADEDDQWQAGYRRALATYETAWAPFRALDQVSATEADARLRAMVALTYEESRSGDEVTLRTEGRSGTVYFFLRTHGERVVSVEGGTATALEEGWYVIAVDADEVRIRLAPSDVAMGGEAS